MTKWFKAFLRDLRDLRDLSFDDWMTLLVIAMAFISLPFVFASWGL